MKRKLSSMLAVFLCLALCLGFAGYADAAEAAETDPAATESPAAEEAVLPESGPEEVIYARLDASGAPQSAYAVVALTLAEEGTVTHYGDYSAVENLTDTSPIEYADGEVTLTAPAGRYYYQGELASAALPWEIEISYALDGREISPEELGGRSGSLEVSIHTAAVDGSDAYFTEGFMLQISVTLDATLCEDIAARNGTVANAGSDKTITFVVLPGGEGDVGFTAEVSDFTMGGFTIAAVPYSMESMVGDMSELDEVTGGVSELTGAINQLTNAALTLRNGADELNANGGSLTSASDQIAGALNEVAAGLQDFDLSDMTGSLSQLQQLPTGLSQIAAGLDAAASGIESMMPDPSTLPTQEQLNMLIGVVQGALSKIDNSSPEEAAAVTTINTTLDMLQGQLGTLTNLSSSLAQVPVLVENLGAMSDGLTQMAVGISSGLAGSGGVDTSAITELQSGMAELAEQYGQFNEGLKAYASGVGELAGGLGSYASGMYTLNTETKDIPGMIDELLGTGEAAEEESGPVSFLDERNEDTASVQFVISTEGVSAPEEDAPEQPEPEDKGFFADLWDKIVALFS